MPMRRLIAVLILTLAGLFLLPVAPSLAAKGMQESKKPPVAEIAEAPEIRRTAIIQNERGEKALRNPLALVRDPKNGDLIVSSFEGAELVVFDRNGAVIKRMGAESDLVSPYGVALDSRGRIYASELNSGKLKIFSPGGILEDEVDLSEARGKPVAPGRIMLDGEGRLYVADVLNDEILILSADLKVLRSLGDFDYLQKAGPIGEGRFVGLSAYGKAVSVFDSDGTLLRTFGEHGGESSQIVSFPTGFALDRRGRLWVADAFQHRLKVFTPEGEFLFNFGRLEEKGEGFFFPVDLCFGEKGELFVLEKSAERIQVFQVMDLKE